MERPLRLTLKEGLNFRRRNVKKRGLDRKDDKVFQSKMVAHFSLTIENIKKAREYKLEKILRHCILGIFKCQKESYVWTFPKICPKAIRISSLYEEFETFIGKIKIS